MLNKLLTSIGGVLATWRTRLLAFLLLALATGFGFVPTIANNNTINIPRGLSTPTPILLTADAPEEIVSTFDSAISFPDGMLLSTSRDKIEGSIFLEKNRGYLTFGYFHLDAVRYPIDPFSNCKMTLRFKSHSGLSLACNTVELASLPVPLDAPKNFPVLTEVFSPNLDTTVTTKTWIYESTTLREGLRLSLIALLVICSASLGFAQLRKAQGKIWSTLKVAFRPNRFDILGAGLLALMYLLAWPEPDDGNVLATLRSYSEVGGLSNYYSASAAFQPTGHPIMDLFAVFASGSNSLLLLRVPAFFFSVASLLIINRIIGELTKNSLQQIQLRYLGLIAFSLGVFSFGVTLRPEPFVNFILVLGLANIIFGRKSAMSLVHTFGISSLAILTHQSGLASLALILFEVYRGEFLLRLKSAFKSHFLHVAIWLSTLMLFATWQVSFYQLIEQVRYFSANYTGYVQPFAAEFNRYMMALEDVPIRAVFVMLTLLLVIGIGFFEVRASVPDVSIRNIGHIVPFLSLCALFFTSSKWEWHFGSLVGIIALGVVSFINSMLESPRSLPNLVIVPWLMLTLSLASVTSSHNFLGDAETFSSTLVDRVFQVALGFQSQNLTFILPWLVFGVGLFVTYFLIGRTSWRATILNAPLIVASMVTAITLAALGSQPFTLIPGFSYAKANLLSILGNDNCGVLKDFQSKIPTSNSNLFSWNYEGIVRGSGTFTLANARQKFVTYTGKKENGKISFRPSSASSKVPSTFVLYARPVTNATATIRVGHKFSAVKLERDVWNPISLEQATNLEISTMSTSQNFSVDVSPLIEVESENSKLLKSLRSENSGVVLDPVFYPATPCLSPSKISGGIFSASQFMIGNPEITDLSQLKWLDVGLKYRAQYSLVKLGCPARHPKSNDLWLDSMCLYKLENIDAGDTTKLSNVRSQGD